MRAILTEQQFKEYIKYQLVKENDRHRPGYYADYSRRRKEQGLSTDRHRPGYYEEYAKTHPEWAAQHPEKLNTNDIQQPVNKKKKKKSRKEYYRQYNLAHPERLERIGVDTRLIGLDSEEDILAMKWFGCKYNECSKYEKSEIIDKIVMDDMRDEDGYGDWYPGDN